jgi:hypothetical protein
MLRVKTILLISITMVLMIGCGGQAEPTLNPPVEFDGDGPSIEIAAGQPDTCKMADKTQSTVMGFDVIYSNMGTNTFMVGLMTAEGVGEVGSTGDPGEGRDGEGNWGLYPQYYDLPPNTPITLEIKVYAGADQSAQLSSTSTLTYDCTTGETLSASFGGN